MVSSKLLAGLHDNIHQQLATSRSAFVRPGTKGDASEHVWLELLPIYLPKRYQAASAHVVDSQGEFSDQMDVVVFNRQYTTAESFSMKVRPSSPPKASMQSSKRSRR